MLSQAGIVQMPAKDGKTLGKLFTMPPCPPLASKKASKSTDWFEAHSVELIPVTVEKRKALAAYKHGLPQ